MRKKTGDKQHAWKVVKIAGIAILVILATVFMAVRILTARILFLSFRDSGDDYDSTLWRCEENENFFIISDEGEICSGRISDGENRQETYFLFGAAKDRGILERQIDKTGNSREVDFLPIKVEYEQRRYTIIYQAEDDTEQIFGPAEGEVTLHFYLAEELPGPVSFTDTGYILGDGTEVPWVEPAG